MNATERVVRIRDLLSRVGRPLAAGDSLLDFGCGNGALVDALATAGFDARGCDFRSELNHETDRIRAIPEAPYRIPFETGAFHCVVSEQVFEHVQDYSVALNEIRRVLRPGGVSLHVFPGRYSLTEVHTFVPFATMVQARWWLALWARAGIRNQFQQGKTASEVTSLNYRYLNDHTTYYTRRKVLRYARQVFPHARLLDVDAIVTRPEREARILTPIVQRIPVVAVILCEMLVNRCLLLE